MGQPSVCHLSSPFDGAAAGDGDVGSPCHGILNSERMECVLPGFGFLWVNFQTFPNISKHFQTFLEALE